MISSQSQLEHRIVLSKQEDNLEPIHSTSADRKKPNFEDRIILHYTHENRFRPMKRDIHEVFREAFSALKIEGLRLIVGHHNSPNLQCELICKRPPIHLIKIKSKSNSVVLGNSLYTTAIVFRSPMKVTMQSSKRRTIVLDKNMNYYALLRHSHRIEIKHYSTACFTHSICSKFNFALSFHIDHTNRRDSSTSCIYPNITNQHTDESFPPFKTMLTLW